MVDVGGVGQVLAHEQAAAADAEGAAAEEVALALGQVLELDAGAVDVAADGDGDLAALHRELEAVEVVVGGDVAHGERRRPRPSLEPRLPARRRDRKSTRLNSSH